MKRIALFLTLLAAGLTAVSSASADPNLGKGNGHGKGAAHRASAPACTGRRMKLELKGTIVSVASDSFAMTVARANHHAHALVHTQLTVQLTADTKIRRKGHAHASDLLAGDRVKVHAWACRAAGGDAAAPLSGPVVAQKVDAHPAKTPSSDGSTSTETTTATP